MSRKNWNKVADRQFESLSSDIKDSWGDLYERTRQRS